VVLSLACAKKEQSEAGAASGRKEISITVDAVGYKPAEARAPAGKPVRLTFTRTTEDGCGEEIVIPSAGVKQKLPVNQPVTIDVTMPSSGKLAFMCGMDMMRGSIVAD
jgi:plastocyanin domain-containing protein